MPAEVFFQIVEAPVVEDPDGQRIISLIMTENWRPPNMHESLTITSKCLVISCISDHSLPPSLADEIHVFTPQLLLHGFIKSLDS
jgi:hypothetical protein